MLLMSTMAIQRKQGVLRATKRNPRAPQAPKVRGRSKADRSVCVLVIDANVLIRDFWWEGSGPQHLLKRLFLMHTLVVPELALREAAMHLEARATDLLGRLDQSPHNDRLLGQYQRLFRKRERDAESPQALARRYMRFIRRMVDTHEGHVAPTPQVSVKRLLDRSLQRIKPFNKHDRGLRDTLLWFGVLELIKRFKRVSFVSENTSDFADKSRRLHPALEQEAQKLLPQNVNFRYFPTLNEFIAAIDQGGSASAEAFIQALKRGGFRGFVLHDWMLRNLIRLVKNVELDSVDWAGVPHHAEDPRLVEIEDIVALEAFDESFLREGVVEFYCNVALIGQFWCSIVYSGWEQVVDHRQVVAADDTDDLWSDVAIRAVGTFMLRIEFDLDNARVSSANIVALEHDYQGAQSALKELAEDADAF